MSVLILRMTGNPADLRRALTELRALTEYDRLPILIETLPARVGAVKAKGMPDARA